MLLIFVLLFLASLTFSGITTIPLAVPLLIVCSVIFRKPSVFFIAFILGLLFDLFLLRPLGQTGLFFIIAIFTVFIYERKFEIQTATVVFFSSFLASLIYLMVFKYDNVLIQSFVSSLLAILLFRILSSKFKVQS